MLRPQLTEALQHYREKGQSTVTPPRSHPSLSCLEAKQGQAWRVLGWEAEREPVPQEGWAGGCAQGLSAQRRWTGTQFWALCPALPCFCREGRAP